MKRWKVGAFACAALLGLACGGGGAETGQGEGVVRAVDPVANRVTLEHGDVGNLMKAMTMDFDVADASLLDGLAPGDQVRFTLLHEDGRYTLVEIDEVAEEDAQ